MCCHVWYLHTHRGLVGVDGDVVHLVDVVVQQTLLGVSLDDLAQGLPAQLLRRQSRRLTVNPIRRAEDKDEDKDEVKDFIRPRDYQRAAESESF